MNVYYYCLQICVSVLIFVILFYIGKFLEDNLKNNSFRYLNPTEYLPEEEVKTLKQFFYLIMILILFILIVNFFFDNDIILSNSPLFYVFHSVLDIVVSVFVANFIYEKSSRKSKVLIFFIMPLASIAFLLFGESLLEYWDFLRIPALLYLIKYFFDKFKDYTDEQGLSISIILLFIIIFSSIVITMFIENEDPLDAVVMVSNAFTSNGYAILGDTTGGKINSIVLVWSGYILSGAATATLTAAILMEHFRRKTKKYDAKLDEMQESLKSYDKKLDELHESIKELKNN